VITGGGALFNCAGVRSDPEGAAIAGVEKIIAIDVLPNKLEFAKRFSAAHTINGSTANAVEQIKALTDGKGVEYAFEAIGFRPPYARRTIRSASAG
jgi:threonine dehydrogenase-like Zn-dependent dehydrogenase